MNHAALIRWSIKHPHAGADLWAAEQMASANFSAAVDALSFAFGEKYRIAREAVNFLSAHLETIEGLREAIEAGDSRKQWRDRTGIQRRSIVRARVGRKG